MRNRVHSLEREQRNAYSSIAKEVLPVSLIKCLVDITGDFMEDWTLECVIT